MALPSLTKRNDIVRRISRVFLNEWSVFQPEFEAYETGYNWLAGEQYTPSQKAWYKAQRRPTHVWNLIFPTFNRALGDFLANQAKDRIYPYSGGSSKMADILQRAIDSELINQDYKDEMAKTILAGLIKRGVHYTRHSNELELDGSILSTNVDEFQLMFDSRALKFFLRDAQYEMRSNWMTVDQIFSLWPQWKSELKKIIKDRESSAYWEAQDESTTDLLCHKELADVRNGKYRVVEFHDREYDRSAEVAYDPVLNESQIITLEGKRRELFIKSNPHLQIVPTNTAEMITTTYVIPGLSFFLEKKDADIQDGYFDYVLFHAYTYGKRVIDHYGLMKPATGPQKDFNDNRNRYADIVNKSANTQTILKPGKILNYSNVKTHGSAPGLIVEVDESSDIDSVYKRLDPARHPIANERLSESSHMLFDRILGITENLKGLQQTAQENASLFAQRVMEASKSFIPVDRNIKRIQAHVINRRIKLMQKFYKQEKFFPVVNPGPDDPMEVAINMRIGDRIVNDITVDKYMVFPSTEERNPMARTLKFMEKTELVKMVAELWGPTAVDPRFWLEDAPIEGVEKLIARIEEAMGIQLAEQEKLSAYQDIQNIMQGANQQLALGSADGKEVTGTPSK